MPNVKRGQPKGTKGPKYKRKRNEKTRDVGSSSAHEESLSEVEVPHIMGPVMQHGDTAPGSPGGMDAAPTPDTFERYERTEWIFYQTTFEKTRLYRKAFEEIETLEAMMSGGSSDFATRCIDAKENLGKLKKEFEQISLNAEEKYGKSFETVKVKLFDRRPLGSSFYARSSSQEAKEKKFEKRKRFEIEREKLFARRKVGSSVYPRSSSQDTEEKLKKLTHKFHHTSLKTLDKYGKTVEDVERLETKGEKMSGQTQGGSSLDSRSSLQEYQERKIP